MTPELMQLGSNEAISNALVEIAVGMGKTETEIGAALGSDWINIWFMWIIDYSLLLIFKNELKNFNEIF